MFANNKIRLLVTSACNIECKYCHNEGAKKHPKYMSDRLVNHLERILHQSRLMVSRIVYTGGEALLHDSLPEYIAKLRRFTESASLVTNGIKLSEDIIVDLKTQGLTKIRLGIDSLSEKHRPTNISGQKVDPKQIVDWCRKHNLIIELNIVISAFNIKEIGNLIEFALSNDVDTKLFRELVEQKDNAGQFAGFGYNGDGYIDNILSYFDEYHPDAQKENDYNGANKIINCDGTQLRYCELLCDKGLCWKSGTRISPEGEIFSCMQARKDSSMIRKFSYNVADDIKSLLEIKKSRCVA